MKKGIVDPHSVNLVIYHASCSDGFGAAWSAWKLLGSRAEYFAASFGSPPPDVRGKIVVCLDFAYPNSVTKQMIADSEDFLVIDHHKSAMVDLVDVSETRFDMTKSGAMLAWEFFHPGKEAPKFIKYIQDRDLWHWLLPYSREFSASFSMSPFHFEEYDSFCDDSVFDDAVKRGSFILAYQRTVINKLVSQSCDRIIRGHPAKVVNTCHLMSEIGMFLAQETEVAVMWWYDHRENVFRISLRSNHENIDVSEVAKSFGGGGHRQSAGFVFKGSSIESIFDGS